MEKHIYIRQQGELLYHDIIISKSYSIFSNSSSKKFAKVSLQIGTESSWIVSYSFYLTLNILWMIFDVPTKWNDLFVFILVINEVWIFFIQAMSKKKLIIKSFTVWCMINNDSSFLLLIFLKSIFMGNCHHSRKHYYIYIKILYIIIFFLCNILLFPLNPISFGWKWVLTQVF